MSDEPNFSKPQKRIKLRLKVTTKRKKRRLPSLLACLFGPRITCLLTCRMSAYAGMLHVPPDKVCLEDIIYPHVHTPGYFFIAYP